MGRGQLHAVSYQVNQGQCFRKSNKLYPISVSLRGTDAAEWDRKTWEVFNKLALNCPESGIHFQGRIELFAYRDSHLSLY